MRKKKECCDRIKKYKKHTDLEVKNAGNRKESMMNLLVRIDATK